MRSSLVLALAAAVGAALGASAQTLTHDAAVGPVSVDGLLKQRLRNLVVAEEAFWANHGTYTTDVSQLGVFTPGPSPDATWVQVLSAGGRSWSGRATYVRTERPGLAGKSCVVYIGVPADLPSGAPATERDSLRATQEGAPVCDKF